MTFDVHQHLWPEAFLSALSRRSDPPRLRGRTLELAEGVYEVDPAAHEVPRRLALLDRDGIDVAVVSLQTTLGAERHPELVAAYHDGIAELVAAAGGRLRAFACGECREGFAGACVSAERLRGGIDELAGALERTEQVLFVHPGPAAVPPDGSPPWWPAVVDYTAQLHTAYAAWIADGTSRFPALPVVFAILAGGAPFQLERLRSRGLGERAALEANVYLETSSYGRRALALCLEAYGPGRLLYGSDVPVIDSRPTLEALRGLGPEVFDAVAHVNPTGLLA
jgi:6-methylsalicylate decarboxylase